MLSLHLETAAFLIGYGAPSDSRFRTVQADALGLDHILPSGFVGQSAENAANGLPRVQTDLTAA